VRVFLDTNVLVSAFATRGLCVDVLRVILSEHDLVTSEPVLTELSDVLRQKIRLPPDAVDDVLELMRRHEVLPAPREVPALAIQDRDDLSVIGSALDGDVDLFVTGDRELRDLDPGATVLRIVSPRDFWTLLSGPRGDGGS
jgi:putative PIN family toxin of toxin-antitoxin system